VKLAEKKVKEANLFFEEALTKNPDFVPAMRRLLNILVTEKKPDMAIERCRQQIAKRPENSGYYVLLGRLYSSKQDYALARKNFELALEKNPNNQEALLALARLEESTGSIDEAIAKYKKIREMNPENLNIALLAARLFEQKGEYKKAKIIYEEVLDKNPDSAIAANNLAFYYTEHEPTEENLARAEKLIRPLVQKYKDVAQLLDTEAWIYYRKGDYEKARDILLGVVEKVRDIPVANYHLGMILLHLGEKEKAREYLQLAVNSKEPFPGKEEAKNALEQ
jgi:tetratricopeptide (TPR) repeat protein